MKRSLSWALVLLVIGAPDVFAALRWEVVESSEELLRVRVEAEGAQLVQLPPVPGQSAVWSRVELSGALEGGEPGQPLLPRSGRWIVLPPEGTVRTEVRVLRTRSLGQARLLPHATPEFVEDAVPGEPRLSERVVEGADYEAFRLTQSDVARVGEPVFQRRQRMAPVELQPVLYDARTGQVDVAELIEITVRFPRSAGFETEAGPPDAAVSVSALNGEMAARWRCLSPELRERRARWSEGPQIRQPKRAQTGVATFDRTALIGSEIRLRAEDTGLTRVRLSDLIGGHGLPTDQPRRYLRLYQKRASDPLSPDYPTPLAADVPFAFVGAPDPDAPPTTADVIVFYAFSAQDDWVDRTIDGDDWPRSMPERPDSYNSANVYFIAMMDPGPGSWKRIASITLGASQGANVQADFQQEQTFTDDAGYQDNPASIGPIFERFHWNAWIDSEVVRSLPLLHPVPGGQVDVTWTSARRSLDSVRQVEYLLEKDGQTWPLTELLYTSFYDTLQPTTVSVATDPIGSGFVRFVMRRLVGGVPSSVNAFLGSITLSYPALYRAEFDELDFHGSVEGVDVDLVVDGFASDQVRLWEITDPRAPRLVTLQGSNRIDNGNGTYRLSLHVPQGVGERRRFLAAPDANLERIRSSRIQSDPVADVFETISDQQILALGPESLRTAVQPWLSWRRDHNAYGWDVAYVDVQQIYDQFSGGLQSPYAIKSLAEYAYVQWDARALVLVGDANEDARGVGDNAGPNLVPPSLHVQTFSTNRELLASDKWYAIFGASSNFPTGLTRTADMVVGRLPVADAAQLGEAIQKIQAYEQPRPDDAWRTRTLWAADDAYSTDYIGSGSGDCYSLHPSELLFASSQTRNADVVATALDGRMSGTVWDLDTFTAPCRQGVTCEAQSAVTQCAQGPARDRLFELLDQGWLIVSYQGHANFRSLGHEGFMQRAGLPSLSNNGRPFLFFGMGCHVTDFVQAEEGLIGQSLGEVMLNISDRGAIATYGSSGFEFLQPNKAFMEEIADVFFVDGRTSGPALGTETLRGQWMLAEVLAQAELNILATPGVFKKDEMVAQYNVLGDPLLRMDALPPRLDARREGAALTDGAELVADAGQPTTTLTFDLVDETGVDRLEIIDSEGRDYASQLVLDPVTDPRARSGSIALPIYPQSYTIDLDLYDGAYYDSRPTSLQLAVSVEKDVTIDGVSRDDTDVIVPLDRTVPVEIGLTTPVDLVQSEIDVSMEGGTVSGLATAGSGRDWTLTFDAIASSEDVQAFLLELAPGVVERVSLTGTTIAQLSVGAHYPIPNPMRGGQPVNIVAEANDSVEGARLTVYDLSGRTVFARDLPVTSEETQPGTFRFVVRWDARDHLGDEVANGTYLYRLEARRGGSVSRSDMGRIVVMR